MKNAFTIDVEDYFQVEAFSKAVDRSQWDNYPFRAERNTQLILDLLDKHHIKGTFFILGWVAKKAPYIVKEIASRGHEIACHGMSHRLIYTQDKKVFQDETRESKKLLEDICQQEVIGYRAATYSITEKSLWALDILVEEGFKYDSSIFPMRHDRYGIPDANPLPHKLATPSGATIIEFPITVLRKKHLTLPVAGGGYFRLLPYALTKWGLNQINKQDQSFVFYLHPWEVDPEQPRIKGAGILSNIRHYTNLRKTTPRLDNLLDSFPFDTMSECLKDLNLL